MKPTIPLLLLLASFFLAETTSGDRGQDSRSARPPEKYHAYWLKAGGDHGYHRLLVTLGPIAASAGRKATSTLPLDNIAFTFRTYKTDSLWNAPFRCVDEFGSVDAAASKATIDGVSYSYEPCSIEAVIRLMENPYGTQPIHRRDSPLKGATRTAKAFCHLLREQLRSGK